MPWSNIVKRHFRTNQEVQPYILEEVEEPVPCEDFPAEMDQALRTSPTEQPVPAPALSCERGYNDGLKEGESKGFAEGKAQGLTEGKTQGFAEGKVQGFTEGEAKGFAEGKVQGFTEGGAKGFAEGETAGKAIREEELQEITETRKLLLRLVEDFQYLTETYVSEAEQDLLQIVVAVAQKVIKKELTQDYEGIVRMVCAALKGISPMKSVVLRIHPQDAERLTQRIPEILEAVGGIGFLKIEPDPKLALGDSILETEDRIVDARPIVQLEAIKMRLLPEGEKRGEDHEAPGDALPGSD